VKDRGPLCGAFFLRTGRWCRPAGEGTFIEGRLELSEELGKALISDLHQLGFFSRIFWKILFFGLLCVCLGQSRAFFDVIEKMLYQIVSVSSLMQGVVLDRDFDDPFLHDICDEQSALWTDGPPKRAVRFSGIRVRCRRGSALRTSSAE
jgi:hypothetical protein